MSKKKEVTKEELEAILSAHNISFSDIAKIATTIKEQPVEEKTKVRISKPKTTPTAPTYEITKMSYPDFVVTKKTKMQTRELVIAPSCDGFFIRTLKQNGQWDVDTVDGNKWATFWADCESEKMPILPEEFYVNQLERGKTYGDALISYLNFPNIKNMIKDRCAPKFKQEQFGGRPHYYYGGIENDIVQQTKIYSLLPLIYKEYHNNQSKKIRDLVKRDPGMLIYVYRIYGIEKARDFIKHYNMCLYDNPLSTETYRYGDYSFEDQDTINKFYGTPEERKIVSSFLCKIPMIRMDYETFKEYVLYESYRFGYSSMNQFAQDWNDTLRMEQNQFGKIKEKYPDNLPVMHNKLIRRGSNRTYYKDAMFIEKFKERAKELKEYNWNPEEGKYKFIVPQVPTDVLEEADMQSNCLVTANYMQRVVNKTSIIIFMRNKETPDRSYITIEIIGDTITQAYLASNRIPHERDKVEIRKYAEHLGIKYDR